jgi:hypothetical protein
MCHGLIRELTTPHLKKQHVPNITPSKEGGSDERQENIV